jgi:hypothetical protein
MLVSVHIADVGPLGAVDLVRKPPKVGAVSGLRHADLARCTPLRSSVLPTLTSGRVALVASWEDDAALDALLDSDEVAARAAGGRAAPFHHRSAFARFRPYAAEGGLDGRNPLAQTWAERTPRTG